MPSSATSTPCRWSSPNSTDRLIENGIGVVDVDQYLAHPRGKPVELLEHAAGPALRQMADVPRAFAARRPTRIISSSLQKVPSTSTQAAARMNPHSRSSMAESPGA